MSHTCPLSSEIIVGGNHITITKSMVTKVLGIPQGSEPVVTQSKCKEVTDAVNRIKEKYVERKQYPISKCEELMKNDHDEVSFMRSFMMLLISTIIAPGKDNCCSIEYLYSLVDISKIQSYDWAGMILDKVMSEVKRYHNNVNSSDPQKRNMKFYYEGFLPLLAIIYVDFLDLQGQAHQLNYGVPRICNFSSQDFIVVSEADRKPNSEDDFGALQIRDISRTPYAILDFPSSAGQSAVPHEANTSHPKSFNVLDPKSQAVVDRLSLYWDTEFKMKTDNYVREVQLLHANVVNKLVTELAASHNSSNNHPETNIDSMDLSDQNLCEKFHDAMNLEVPKSKIVTPTKSSRSVSIETDTSSGSSAPEHNDTSAGTDENISPKLDQHDDNSLPHPHFENQSANVAHPANDDSDQQQKEPLPVFPATSIFPTMEDDSHVNVAPKSSQAHFDNQSGNVADPGNDDSDDQQKDPFPVLPAASLFPQRKMILTLMLLKNHLRFFLQCNRNSLSPMKQHKPHNRAY